MDKVLEGVKMVLWRRKREKDERERVNNVALFGDLRWILFNGGLAVKR